MTTSVQTTEKYWDCECEERYIHPATQEKCSVCGCEKDDQPDSIITEVIAELEAQNKRLVEALGDTNSALVVVSDNLSRRGGWVGENVYKIIVNARALLAEVEK